MTPKEKARQMVLSMSNNIGLNAKSSSDQCIFEAKKCAIIATDYLIDEWNNEGGRKAKQKYWMDVRNEVERFTNDIVF
jgi:hypothetical protein